MSPAGGLPFRVVGETVVESETAALDLLSSVYPTLKCLYDESDEVRVTVKGRNVAYFGDIC